MAKNENIDLIIKDLEEILKNEPDFAKELRDISEIIKNISGDSGIKRIRRPYVDAKPISEVVWQKT